MIYSFVHRHFPGAAEAIRNSKQKLFHMMKIYPIYEVIDRINRQIPLSGCRALDVFAGTGGWQTLAFRKYPSYLEAWEIDPVCESALRRNLPNAEIKITDSIKEITNCKKIFGFVNVDNHQGEFGPYCEHFDIFPAIFDVLENEAVVLMNVMPSATQEWRAAYKNLFNESHLARRKAFYGCPNPANIGFDEMLEAYERRAAEKGFRIDWHFFQQRTLTYYLAVKFTKKA